MENELDTIGDMADTYEFGYQADLEAFTKELAQEMEEEFDSLFD